jgi:hypothetical protein
VPLLIRSERAEPYRQQILEQWINCKGNLVRVHEELVASGLTLSYPALTAFCRRHGIGQKPKVAVGLYEQTIRVGSPEFVNWIGKAVIFD